jgi:integrase/recombinase XerD
MTLALAPISSGKLTRAGLERLPALIARAGEKASWCFIEFFAANIRNKNTRTAYAHAVTQFFNWCESRRFGLHDLRPALIALYIEQHPGSSPTVKQHLAAIRMLFDWLVIGQMNPASSVRGPKLVVKVGKTPVLKADQARQLLDSIDTTTIVGLRG